MNVLQANLKFAKPLIPILLDNFLFIVVKNLIIFFVLVVGNK